VTGNSELNQTQDSVWEVSQHTHAIRHCSSVTQNAAVPTERDLFFSNSVHWSDSLVVVFSLIDTLRMLEASVVCIFHLLNRKEKETSLRQVR